LKNCSKYDNVEMLHYEMQVKQFAKRGCMGYSTGTIALK